MYSTHSLTLCVRVYVCPKALGAQSFPTAVTANQTQAPPANRHRLVHVLRLLLQQLTQFAGWLNAGGTKHSTLEIHGLSIVLSIRLSHAYLYMYVPNRTTHSHTHTHIHMACIHTCTHTTLPYTSDYSAHKYMHVYILVCGCGCVFVCTAPEVQHSSLQQDTGHYISQYATQCTAGGSQRSQLQCPL